MKHVMALFCILFSLCAQAQFTSGDKFIGGNITMRHYSYRDGTGNSNVGLSPTLGFFLRKNFAVGIAPGYSTTTYKIVANRQVTDKQTLRTFTYGLFAKRFFTISDKFFFALTCDVSYARDRSEITHNGFKSTAKNYEFNAAIVPSFIFFPSTHWGIEASLGNLSYITRQQLHATDTRTNQFDFNAGTFSLGFSYYFRK